MSTAFNETVLRTKSHVRKVLRGEGKLVDNFRAVSTVSGN